MDSGVFHEFRQRLSTAFDTGSLSVACHLQDDDTILGWALGDRALRSVVFVWVRKDFRHRGLAAAIFKHAGGLEDFDTYAIQTKHVDRYSLDVKSGLRYRPWPIFDVIRRSP